MHIERTQKRGLVGNIYKGRVSRVLPGMQAAFIDIGLERTGFLHTSDITGNSDEDPVDEQEKISFLSIESMLSKSQEILVQVIKDPLGSKGARLTTRISIPSRYLVYVPDYQSVGISQRIEEEAERERLRKIIMQYQSGIEQLVVGNGDNVVHHTAASKT